MAKKISKKSTKYPSNIDLLMINRLLAITLMVLGLYILIAPFIPKLIFSLNSHNFAPYSGNLSNYYTESGQKQPLPQDNRLVIPSLNINESIKEGTGIETINNNGVWRRPASSDNPNVSNMVVVGHRFLYSNPYGTFYHLDKLKVGDKLAVYWQGAEHVYEVNSVRVADPNDKSVESPSVEPELTLYTCTPLITATNRLVVKAKEIR